MSHVVLDLESEVLDHFQASVSKRLSTRFWYVFAQ